MRGWMAAAGAGLIALVLLTAQPSSAAKLTVDGGVLQVFTYPAHSEVPTAPSGLNCVRTGLLSRHLQWQPSLPAQGYRVYHKGPWPFDGDFGLLTQIPDSSVTSYDGLTLSLLRHSYYMTSYFDSWESPPTETISVYCRPRIFFPGPCELEGENHHSQRVVELAWEPVAGAVSYGVLRGTEPGGPYEVLDATDATAYSDAAVSEGVTYYYVIVAVDAAGNESDPSGELVIEDTAPPEPTPTPDDTSNPPAPTPTATPENASDPRPTPTPTAMLPKD